MNEPEPRLVTFSPVVEDIAVLLVVRITPSASIEMLEPARVLTPPSEVPTGGVNDKYTWGPGPPPTIPLETKISVIVPPPAELLIVPSEEMEIPVPAFTAPMGTAGSAPGGDMNWALTNDEVISSTS
jgi:hypothetical protein